MPPVTYEPIATTTVTGATAANMEFTSIPATYTDLVVIILPKLDTSTAGLRIRFNGDTGSLYSQTVVYGDGTSAGSARNSNATSAKLSDAVAMNNTNDFNCIVNVMNYSNSTTNKTYLARTNIASGGTEAVVGLYRPSGTAAITSITLFPTANNFATGSTASLYGIKSF